ncbi:LamB/YcsF family protein [Pseudaestuariivita rosea]|uniref:LamB/YcsF family protein n=1 Tax=Pseudaestuariivita rosea TaxID=2763263 RepID=UPI001ABA60C9|nr:5-oxoprolinase subunit PxpA [Pseudaestuariivita rosea]
MSKKIDLNADMGESFGPWRMGNDDALLDIVTSANIACGFHAGDPDTMARTIRQAVAKGVGIGAHPGFADLQGFGRRRISLSQAELENLVIYQLGAAQAMAKAAGGKVRHFKLHGALSNMASESIDIARTCYQAALRVQPDLVIMVLSATPMEYAVRDMGCAWAGEIFADRAYNDDATLVDRSKPGAVIHDPDHAADRILNMLDAGAIISESGHHIPCRIDTICLHGDGKTALDIAQTVKTRLIRGGYTLASL